MTATPASPSLSLQRPGVRTQAAIISEAHRVLLQLTRGVRTELDGVSEAALSWLEDRQLIEILIGDEGMEYTVTPRGRQAVLGIRAA